MELGREPSPGWTAEPERIGPWRVLRELGRGSAGVVYEAERTGAGGRAALKVLARSVLPSDRQLARFEREREFLAALRHPGIVAVLDRGEHDGRAWLALELAEGGTLQDELARLRRAPRRTSRAELVRRAERIASVAEALAHAHGAGLLHRDVKPSNILLRADGSAALSDFGLARAEDSPALTYSGELTGSPYYLAPEQAVGGRGAVDARADVYSLGVTLYEYLTLRRPFSGSTPAAILLAIATRPIDDPRRWNRSLPEPLAAIVERATRRDPAARYSSAAALARDLRAFGANQPVAARRPTLAQRIVASAVRRPARAALIALLALALPAAAGTLLAVLPAVAAARALARDSARSELTAAGFAALIEADYDGAGRRFGEALAVEPADDWAFAGLVLSTHQGGDPARANALVERALAAAPRPDLLRLRATLLQFAGRTAEALLGAASCGEPRTCLELYLAAYAALAAGENEVPDAYREALDLFRRAALLSGRPREQVWHGLTVTAAALRDEPLARALAGAIPLRFPGSPRMANMAAIATTVFDQPRGLALLRARSEREAGGAEAENALGVQLRVAGDPSGAEAALRRAIAAEPGFALAHFNLGKVLYFRREYPAAVAEFDQAVALEPAEARYFSALANAHFKLGDFAAARRCFERAVELRPDCAEYRATLGGALHRLGESDLALASFERALELDPGNLRANHNAAVVLLRLGRREQALSHFRRTLELDPLRVAAWRDLVPTLARVGRTDEARDAAVEALATNPASQEIAFDLGRLVYLHLDAETGIELISSQAARAPADPEIHERTATLLAAVGRPQLARAERERFLRATGSARAWNDLAWFLGGPDAPAATRDPGRARACARQALVLEPDNARFLDTLAWTTFESGDTCAALAASDRALELATLLEPALLPELAARRARIAAAGGDR